LTLQAVAAVGTVFGVEDAGFVGRNVGSAGGAEAGGSAVGAELAAEQGAVSRSFKAN
jgi:hypothetical protein